MATRKTKEEQAQDHYRKAQDYENKNEYVKACNEYKNAVVKDPKLTEIYEKWLNQIKKISNKATTYINAFKRVVEKQYNNDHGYNLIGNAYLAHGLYNEANEQFVIAVNKTPLYHGAYFNWGLSLFKQEEYVEAIEKFKKATDIYPEYSDAFHNWSLAISKIDKKRKYITEYKSAIETRYDKAEGRNFLGYIYYSDNKFKEAIKQFEISIKNKPGERYPYYMLGLSYDELEDYDKAIDNLKESISIDKDHHESYVRWSDIIPKLKDPKSVTKEFETTIIKNHDDDRGRNTLGNLYYDLEQYDKALIQYKNALDKNSQNKSIHYNMGLANEKLKNYDESIRKYKETIKIDNNYVNAFTRWKYVLKFIEEPQEEIRDFETYVKKYWNTSEGLKTLADLLSQVRDFESAEKYYQKAMQLDPESPDPINNCGNLYFNHRRYDAAIEKYLSCLKVRDKYIFPYNNLGLVYRVKGDYDTSIEYYEKGLRIETDNLPSLTGLALTYQARKDYDNAMVTFQKAVNKFPEDAESYYNIGNVYLDLKNYSKALEFFEKAYEIDSEYVYAQHNCAHTLNRMGEHKQSYERWISVLNKYKEKFKDYFFYRNPYHHQYIAAIFQDILGDYENAIYHHEIALDIDPENAYLLAGYFFTLTEVKRRSIEFSPEISLKLMNTLIQIENLGKQEDLIEDDILSQIKVYRLNEDYVKCRKLLLEELKKDSMNHEIYNLLGLINLEEKNPSKAIDNFKNACKYNLYNTDYMLNMAKAYLENKDYEEAEKYYQKIFNDNKNNVDAIIGLGEVYLSLSENHQDDPDLLELSQEYFTKALERGTNTKNASRRLNLHEPKPKTNPAKRKYKDIMLSDLYYNLGYLKVKLFEKNTITDKGLLNEAIAHFKNAGECNPDHHKSFRAMSRIRKKMTETKSERMIEKYGSIVVAAAALVIFIMTQIFFYSPLRKDIEKVKLGANNMLVLESVYADNKELLPKIEKFKDLEFTDAETALATLESIIGQKDLTKSKAFLGTMKFESIQIPKEKPISEGLYASLTFGSLIFLIAGLYLPKMLKLKVGSIEIEKNVATEASITSVGISRSGI